LGWAESAAAWITDIGEEGDYGRACVLDRPMLERIHGRRFATALDRNGSAGGVSGSKTGIDHFPGT
jgi:hypothetical protein